MAGGVTRLYATHQPLQPVTRFMLTVGASVGAYLYPQRADLVAAVGELTGHSAFQAIHKRMAKDVTGLQILADRPVIGDDFLQQCQAAPHGSFGHAYHEFMKARRFLASERPPVRFVDDEELAYVALRYRQVHDFWHVLFDCHTNLLGEAALKAVEFGQTGLPMNAASLIAARAKLPAPEQALLLSQVLPWAARAGARSRDLMCIYYERHINDDLHQLRHDWRVITAPVFLEAGQILQPQKAAVAQAALLNESALNETASE